MSDEKNVYQKIGLKRVVNASGRMTILGVSTISDRVARAAVAGGQSYVVVEELMKRAGALIAAHTGAEDACPTCSASAAIALTVAALVSRGGWNDMMRLPDSTGLANEVVLQKGHAVNYGAPMTTMIRLGGGVPVEAGCANEVHPEEIEQSITDKTVALLYVKSHHSVQKGMVDIETMRDIAHAHGLPFMMDCAAEEDFRKYVALGADVVCYSGAKALEATTSGFVCGRAEIIEWVRAQYKGIGRAMKVGKEQIMGLMEALDQYDERGPAVAAERNERIAGELAERISGIEGLRAEVIRDEAGRAIWRCRVTADRENPPAKTMEQVNDELRGGDPCIYARTEFLNLGKIDFDPRPLVEGDEDVIVETLKKIVSE